MFKNYKNENNMYVINMKNIKKFLFTIIFALFIFIILNIDFNISSIYKYIILFIIICIPFFIEYKFKIPLLIELLFTIDVIFIYLGGNCSYYDKISFWDNIIHFISGFILVIVFFSCLRIKFNSSRYLILISIFSLSLSMLTLVSWEIFEYINDVLFNKNMLRYVSCDGEVLLGLDAVKDTLTDISFDMISSIFTTAIIYYLVKYNIKLKNYLLIRKI